MPYPLSDKSLTIVGAGIKAISHLSMEALTYISSADKVLFLINEPILKDWIFKKNKNSECLNTQTNHLKLRIDRYKKMAELILENLNIYQNICVLIYGHPLVFARPALFAAKQAKIAGYHVTVLPGISAEDCLLADLLIDPSDAGCQSYEATDLLLRKHKLNQTSHLLIWQVGFIGCTDDINQYDNSIGLQLLKEYLLNFYKKNHSITFYEAAIYPHMMPKIHHTALKMLTEIPLSSLTTLYIPPTHSNPIDMDISHKLGIHSNYFNKN